MSRRVVADKRRRISRTRVFALANLCTQINAISEIDEGEMRKQFRHDSFDRFYIYTNTFFLYPRALSLTTIQAGKGATTTSAVGAGLNIYEGASGFLKCMGCYTYDLGKGNSVAGRGNFEIYCIWWMRMFHKLRHSGLLGSEE